MSTNKDLFDKLGDDARWEKNERKHLDEPMIATFDPSTELLAEQAESEAEDHGIAPELQLTDSDVDELARRDALNKPAFFGFAEACSILGHPLPRPDLAETRQTAGVRCKDIR